MVELYFSQLTKAKIIEALEGGLIYLKYGYSCYGDIKKNDSNTFLYKPNGGKHFKTVKFESKKKMQSSIVSIVNKHWDELGSGIIR